MNNEAQAEGSLLYTIGHSNHELNAFVELLRSREIEVVVDVRSSPFSKYASHFNHDRLARDLDIAGIEYVYLGAELGGMPDDPSYYDNEGHVMYDVVADSERFRSGIARLVRRIDEARTAIMCGEEDPSSCHRRLLVGRAIRQLGYEITHIRGDGTAVTEQELAESEKDDQLALFPEEEDKEWRSTQSVLLKKRQRASSDY